MLIFYVQGRDVEREVRQSMQLLVVGSVCVGGGAEPVQGGVEVARHGSASKPRLQAPMHAPLSYWTAPSKHKIKEAITKNFQTVVAEH